jgi:hypothetical protein
MDPIATPSTDAALPTTLGGVLTAEAPSPTLSEDALRSLGMKLSKDFDSYDQDRRLAELQWARNLRQFLGVYDPETEKDIPKDRSRAYPKLTRVKCVSMVARLMNLLFPAGDKNWAIDASPVPNLSQEDLQSVLDQLQQAPDAQLTDDTITAAVREFAAKRAKNLEAEIEDQLKELGGSRTVSFVTLCKRVLMAAVRVRADVGLLPGYERQVPAPDGRAVPAHRDVACAGAQARHNSEFFGDKIQRVPEARTTRATTRADARVRAENHRR